MHIKRLYIGDFGILQNQTLEHLNPGLVIVGGRNRAGKSTFMKVLKHLGYGFAKGGQLPPANVRYQVDADVIQEETNTLYHIRLDGQSEPECTLSANSSLSNVPVKDIFPVDAFTYQNVFAVSLEQLARIPEGMSGKEALQLHSVLLGAGLSDIAGIPQMEGKFMKEAKAIGGQKGSISNKGFSPYTKQIEEGIKRKKQALAQVEEYQEQQKMLEDTERNLKAMRQELQLQQANCSVLELLRGNYDVFEEVGLASAALEQHEGSSVEAGFPQMSESAVQANYDRYQELEGKWQEQYDLFRNSLENKESAEKLIPLLLKNRNILASFTNRLSGLRERWNQLNALRDKAKEEQNSLLIRMKRLNPSWTERDIGRIEGLSLDLLEENKLMDAIARFRQIRDQLDQLVYRKDEIRLEEERLKQQKAEWKVSAPAANLKLYLWVFALSAVLGMAVFSYHQAAGLFLGLFGIAGAALFVFMKSLGQKEANNKLRELDSAISGCDGQSAGLENRIQQQKKEQNAVEEYLTAVRKELGMEESVVPDSILEYYRALVDQQERITRMHLGQKEADEIAGKLGIELAEMKKVLDELENCQFSARSDDLKYPEDWQSPDNWQLLQSELVKWYGRLQTVNQLDSLSFDRNNTAKKLFELIQPLGQSEQPCLEAKDTWADSLEEAVEAYLSLCRSRAEFLALQQRMETLLQGLNRAVAADRLKKAVSLLNPHSGSKTEAVIGFSGGKPELDYFFMRHRDYPSQDSLDKEYFEASSRIQELEGQIERCKEEIQRTKNNLERLALTTELEQAHGMIDQGRSDLYPIARQYAVNKAAAWLCRDIKNRFMDKMRDELLKNADSILRELTSGEYEKMTPGDNLLNPDFAFTLADGSTQDGADILSRGTREQVFLAVRLGRILDTKPALPVIIDDSFVNYDPLHLKQAVRIIRRLSSTHQIFLMTCHPHLINLAAETGAACQYWQLENGQFTESDKDSLAKHLQVGTVS
jgi:uncharacterized protein YhaN